MGGNTIERVGMWFGWAAVVLMLVAAPVAYGAAPQPPGPPNRGSAGELPRPPADGAEPATVDEDSPDDSEPELTEEQKLLQRRLEFQEHMKNADIATRRSRDDDAVREYTAALLLFPGDPSALQGRAYARFAATPVGRCPRRALKDLFALEKEDPKGAGGVQPAVAIDWMALCGTSLADRRLALARSLADEPVGTAGRPAEIRFVLARLLYQRAQETDPQTQTVEPREEALAALEAYRQECRDEERKPAPEAVRLQADIYREVERLKDAVRVYGDLLELHPSSKPARDAGKIRDDLEFQLELRQLDATQGYRPTVEAEAAYQRGLSAEAIGRFQIADTELSWAIEDSPWFPRAYAARGRIRAKSKKFLQAEDDLKRAVRMDRSDHHAHILLGQIYRREFAGAKDGDAIKHLSAALRLRPDLNDLHLVLGELYARTDREKAREHYERYIRQAPLDDENAKSARKALQDLEREIRRDEPPAIPPPPVETLRFLDPELQRTINEAYLRGIEQQDWDMAEKILMAARDKFPSEPVVFNELARVVYHQDRFGDARQYWEASLKMVEDQVEVHERLGLLLKADLPDKAAPYLRRAAELGSLAARFVLAELLWEQNDFFEASDQLDLYLQRASDYELNLERAQALRDEIDARFLQGYIAASVTAAVLILVPALRIYRRYRGSSLRQLLERDPKSFPQVARIVSLIRHEILKHNTAFLTDVGRALELDAPEAESRAQVLGRRLFGEHAPGLRTHNDDERAGIYGRFLGYVDELEKVARAHRVTLNLRRKDPIFRPMLRAFEEIARWGPAMRDAHGIRPGKKLELARVLHRSGHVLGRQAFDRLSGLIRELCIVNVDTALVGSIYEQVIGEDQFASAALVPLAMSGQGAPVRIFRTDLADVLANVLRNSLRSSLEYAPTPVGISVDLVSELDEITGLGSLAIRIKDRSSEQLSNEMLRGRYLERGMGITVDLLSRYDGSIAVEPEPGWSKAVVLRFFILEDDPMGLEVEAAQ